MNETKVNEWEWWRMSVSFAHALLNPASDQNIHYKNNVVMKVAKQNKIKLA